MYDILENYAESVFSPKVMKERLPLEVYDSMISSIRSRNYVDRKHADVIAHAMRDWALEKGVTHFTHWFQPMTGVTAEKHQAFLDFEGDRELILEFSGKELIMGENDASSFPSGGIRETYEARGYTAWDPTSYAFVKGTVLYIPTAFCSYTGEALDKKTPLLRSMQALSKEGQRLLRLFGEEGDTDVLTNVGAEQEYFLIDESMYEVRPDLVFSGRTLFGCPPPKGQDLDDHFFGVIKPRVADFMEDLDEQLWSLGIASKTRHNEVAPAQHEVTAIYESANASADHNQLIMETLKTVAPHHGLVALTNEKPFAGVNGSGKHVNWSLSTSGGENLFEPGKTPASNARFLLFLCAVIKAIDLHQDLMRMSVATAANDHRLGKDEAPPAIISIFLGDELTEILEAIKTGEAIKGKEKVRMHIGVDALPTIPKDNTDRNRTSPFAFTGNKFEFRMVGSSQSISGPCYVLNTIVADVFAEFADRLEKASDFNSELAVLIRETISEHERIIFNGNGYSTEWREEAESRGLPFIKSTVDAMPCFITPENKEMFNRHGVLSPVEAESRFEMLLETYSTILHIETNSMLEIVHKGIIPAVVKYITDVAKSHYNANALSESMGIKASDGLSAKLYKRLVTLGDELYENVAALEKADSEVPDADAFSVAKYYRDVVVPAQEKLRSTVDELESITDYGYWPLPSYGEILYSV